ncbi:MAG TPA: peptide chain release factor N(5)-glutamine methyltransferase [Burkholderiales bacterium]|nr:peptide chain release factor N(5)-glutamine methyltransferase [Burkholderiales bacterium]
MTVAEALRGAGIDAREARLLLAAAAQLPEARIAAHPERPLEAPVRARFEDWALRRRAGEPIAYLIGWREFYGLRLAVTPAVLIPRPETELLVECALQALPRRGTPRVLDLGTGSGAVALAIKHARGAAQVVGVEASAAALAVACGNAARLGLEVDWRRGEWFAAAAGERFDLIVSNPPYVAQGDPHLSQGDLRYEPREALVAGADGLDAIRCVARGLAEHLRSGGWAFVEHGFDQAEAVRACLNQAGLTRVETWRDLAGHPRVSGGCAGTPGEAR